VAHRVSRQARNDISIERHRHGGMGMAYGAASHIAALRLASHYANARASLSARVPRRALLPLHASFRTLYSALCSWRGLSPRLKHHVGGHGGMNMATRRHMCQWRANKWRREAYE